MTPEDEEELPVGLMMRIYKRVCELDRLSGLSRFEKQTTNPSPAPSTTRTRHSITSDNDSDFPDEDVVPEESGNGTQPSNDWDEETA